MKKHSYILVSAFMIISILISCKTRQSSGDTLQNPVVVPLKPYVSRLFTIDAVVNSDTLRLLFDTGGGQTVIGPNIAKNLGCEPHGRTVGFRMTGEQVISQICPDITLNIGGIDFHHKAIGVWDVRAVLPENLPAIDGILSLKTFSNQPFTLDISNKRLILETKQSLTARVKSMSRLKSRIATGPNGSELDVFLHGVIQKAGWFLLDCGNLDASFVAPHMDVDNEGRQKAPAEKWQARFTLDGYGDVVTDFRTKEIIYDGALSEAFMSKFIFTFDLASNSIWAKSVEK